MTSDEFLAEIKEDLKSIYVFADWLEEQGDERALILRSVKNNSLIITLGKEPFVVGEKLLYNYLYNLFHPFEIGSIGVIERDRIIPCRKEWSTNSIERLINISTHDCERRGILGDLIINSVGITSSFESYCITRAYTKLGIKRVPYWCTKK